MTAAASAKVDLTDALSIQMDGLVLALAGRRLSVTAEGRTLLDVSIGELRRIQFDIERGRPATLVIVPERPSNEPQIVSVPPEQFHAAGKLLAYVGQRLNPAADRGSDD